MINLSTTESSIIFTFTDSNHYLTGDGTIEVPKSSLSLITDDSQMATFRKAPSNDIFVSAPYSEFGKTKAELIEWFEENGFSDGGGVTPEEVEDMIDEAVIPIENDVETISGDVQTLSGEVANKVEQSDFDDLKDEIIDNERVISEAFVAVSGAIDDNAAAISGKADASSVYTKSETDAAITSAISEIQLSGYVETEVFDQKEEAIAHALTDLNERIPDMDDYVTTDTFNRLKAQVSEQEINKANVTYVDNAIDDVEQTIEDNELVTAQAFVSINNRLGGLSFVALTQAEYDALTTKDSNTIYFIKDNS